MQDEIILAVLPSIFDSFTGYGFNINMVGLTNPVDSSFYGQYKFTITIALSNGNSINNVVWLLITSNPSASCSPTPVATPCTGKIIQGNVAPLIHLMANQGIFYQDLT